jgi:hypothetical protein
MNKTVIGVADSNNVVMIEYVNNQLQAIANLFPALQVQQMNENDNIMLKHAKYPDRLPSFFILKNGACVSVLQAKVDDKTLLDWVRATSG